MLLFLFILLNFQLIQALFVVTAPESAYTIQYGDTVEMICSFPVPKEDDLNKLKVSWKHFLTKDQQARQVTLFNNGREDFLSQEPSYKGRASLLNQELKYGRAILKIEEVKLTDAGIYLCLLQLDGSDYQEITLNVQASYNTIKTFSNESNNNELSLTCESLGFPEAKVYWKQNGVNVSLPVNTSYIRNKDGFYKITSTIKGVDINHQYDCVFWNKDLNEETKASTKLSGFTHESNSENPQMNATGYYIRPMHTVVIIGCIIILLAVFVILFYKQRLLCFKCFKKKGGRSSTL
ncbi:hypothetical protein GDO81_001566 [Engystomops pustulosus]|uniref:Ig-like domain-containing protein n=2 Tax=Engystomops pustulosus TaxID=76066 RepID=A0AAV7DHG7_ENGPU|nr:hypothetical protein GDO81_001566 [Engystomops pustulosus]